MKLDSEDVRPKISAGRPCSLCEGGLPTAVVQKARVRVRDFKENQRLDLTPAVATQQRLAWLEANFASID